MGKKNFKEPYVQVVHFNNSVISTSCSCYDELMGVMGDDCTGDGAVCTCQVNHVAGTMNCTPCEVY